MHTLSVGIAFRRHANQLRKQNQVSFMLYWMVENASEKVPQFVNTISGTKYK